MSAIENKFKTRLKFDQDNLWNKNLRLFEDHNIIDLSSGFPDYSPSTTITENFYRVAKQDNLLHQYTRDYGHPRLVNVLSKIYSRLVGCEIDPENEILTTVGAYEALFCTIIGHVDQGDEVIIIEPFYDCYENMVRFAGGTPRFIPLRLTASKKLILDKTELESLFNNKTKLFILNNPHNSFGKVFQLDELQFIAGLCKKWNVLCVADEVYEWIIYNPNKHIRIASLTGMWHRTITIGSAGKTFSVTGWRIGWAYGPSNLLHNLKMVHQNSVYTGNTPMQEAVAVCLEQELEIWDENSSYLNVILRKELVDKRDHMIKFLTDIGMVPIIPDGGCFIMADWASFESLIELSQKDHKWKDYSFTKRIEKDTGVQVTPSTQFYSNENKVLGENFIRFCFFKKDESLQKGSDVLKKWRSSFEI